MDSLSFNYPPDNVKALITMLDAAGHERRARLSCALTILHDTYSAGHWRRDSALHRMLLDVITMNTLANVAWGMTDDEDAAWGAMLVDVLSHSGKGGDK